jgi:hypothetical protein
MLKVEVVPIAVVMDPANDSIEPSLNAETLQFKSPISIQGC